MAKIGGGGTGRLPGNGGILGDLSSWIGFPASTVSSAQPGYQLYVCIWNPKTQHVGNRVPIGTRIAPVAPITGIVSGLPDLTAEDSEFFYLIGCTVDGGEVPYALMDGNGDWLSVPTNAGSVHIGGEFTLDFESELPLRNGVPEAMDRFCTIGDWALGATGIDTLVRVSGSAAAAFNPVVLGRPEQSWAPVDVLMFPFREIVLSLQEDGNDAIVFSNAHMARLVYAQGIWDWADTFPMGIAGRRAFTQSDHGPFWLNYKEACNDHLQRARRSFRRIRASPSFQDRRRVHGRRDVDAPSQRRETAGSDCD